MNTDKLTVVCKEKEYPVYIGDGSADLLKTLVKNVCAGKRAAVISDSNVFPLYGEKVGSLLSDAGYDVFSHVISAGEASKNVANLLEILSFLSSNSFDRHDVVISLGGGVVGDISGLASSLYMRGTKLVHIPTSLLAMVDSCIGGKTGVNTGHGKNMLGTFHNPDLVLCDTLFLSTLNEKEYREGMAEVIKYGVICDEALFEKIKTRDFTNDYIVRSCLEIKKEFVRLDEHDNGVRKKLNFGHTFGHAIEALSGYSVTHGDGVAMGMVIASKLGESLCMCKKSVTDDIVSVLSSYGLPTKCGTDLSKLASFCFEDKKSDGDVISLIIPEKIGNCVIKYVEKTYLKGLLECI